MYIFIVDKFLFAVRSLVSILSKKDVYFGAMNKEGLVFTANTRLPVAACNYRENANDSEKDLLKVLHLPAWTQSSTRGPSKLTDKVSLPLQSGRTAVYGRYQNGKLLTEKEFRKLLCGSEKEQHPEQSSATVETEQQVPPLQTAIEVMSDADKEVAATLEESKVDGEEICEAGGLGEGQDATENDLADGQEDDRADEDDGGEEESEEEEEEEEEDFEIGQAADSLSALSVDGISPSTEADGTPSTAVRGMLRWTPPAATQVVTTNASAKSKKHVGVARKPKKVAHHPHTVRGGGGGSVTNPYRTAIPRSVGQSSALPLVVVDAPNVAMRHGLNQRFSCKGIQLALNFFAAAGHKVMSFLPVWK